MLRRYKGLGPHWDKLYDGRLYDQGVSSSWYLIQAVNSGTLPKADEHPMFREVMSSRHKAYLVDYLVSVCKDVDQIETFMAEDIREEVRSYFAHSDFINLCWSQL